MKEEKTRPRTIPEKKIGIGRSENEDLFDVVLILAIGVFIIALILWTLADIQDNGRIFQENVAKVIEQVEKWRATK